VGVLCAYVSRQAEIVRERKELWTEIESSGQSGIVETRERILTLNPKMDLPDVSLIRRLLGDQAIASIEWREYGTDAQRKEIDAAEFLFPEASLRFRE